MGAYISNIPLENLAALLVITAIAIFGRNRGLPVVIIVFYLLYMALDYAFYGAVPPWPELTTAQEQLFNLLCVAVGLIVILILGIIVQLESERLVEWKVLLPNGKKGVVRWFNKLVVATYAVIVAVFWCLPYTLQLLTISYTWPLHAAIMEHMIFLDIGLACLAQLGKPLGYGLKDHG